MSVLRWYAVPRSKLSLGQIHMCHATATCSSLGFVQQSHAGDPTIAYRCRAMRQSGRASSETWIQWCTSERKGEERLIWALKPGLNQASAVVRPGQRRIGRRRRGHGMDAEIVQDWTSGPEPQEAPGANGRRDSKGCWARFRLTYPRSD